MSAPPGAPAPITDADLERLIKLLGMLGSGFEGEAENARALVNAWLAKHRVDWRALLMLEVPAQTVSVGGHKAVTWEQEARAAGWMEPADVQRLRQAGAGAEARAQYYAAQVAAQAAAPPVWPNPYGNAANAGLGAGLGAQNYNPYAQAQPNYGPGAQQAAGGSQMTPTGPQASWRDAAQAVMDHYPHVLRGTKETDFVTSRLGNRRWATLTPAQEQWMRDICGRAGLSW